MRLEGTLPVALLIGLLCCSTSSKQSADLPGVILPVDQVKCIGITDTANAWLPSPEQIVDLEQRLTQYLKSLNNPNAKLVADSLHTYRHQYLGVTDGGRQLIYVNAFCGGVTGTHNRWKTELVVVLDGGPCYFHLFYDPQTRTFSRLMVNGDA